MTCLRCKNDAAAVFAYVRPTPQEPLSRAPLLYKQTLEHADGRQAKVSCIRIGVCALVVATVVHNAPVTIVVMKTGGIFQDESSIVIPKLQLLYYPHNLQRSQTGRCL